MGRTLAARRAGMIDAASDAIARPAPSQGKSRRKSRIVSDEYADTSMANAKVWG